MGTRFRRIQDRRCETLFRGREFARLLTMIAMLAVLYMLMDRARDVNTWRWLVTDHEAPLVPNPARGTAISSASAPALPSPADASALSEGGLAGNLPAAGPTAGPPVLNDLDEDEMDAALYEFQAVEDKKPLTAIEMPAYWRLAAWARNTPLEDLQQRARRDVFFTHLFEAPEEYRGELIRLRLHVVRSLWNDAPESNPLGVTRVYEAWGWTDESSTNPYQVVFTEVPQGMPIGPTVLDEVTFYGYFFKLFAYKARDDKLRAAPMLIGRIVWHPSAAALAGQRDPREAWFWPTLLIGGGVVLFVMYRFSRLYSTPPRRPAELPESKASLGNWLQQTPADEGDPASHAQVEQINGFHENGRGQYLGDQHNSPRDTEA